jgi:hypothetical protein
MTTSDKNLEEVLRAAVAAVDAAEVPDDLRPAAFGKAVDLLSSKMDEPAPSVEVTTPANALDQTASEGDPIGSIASTLGIDRQLVDDTYYVDDDGGIRLSVGSTKLAAVEQEAQKEIALLLAAGRQGGGLEEWTKTKHIRESASDYSKMNHHFAENMSEMDDEFSFKGKGATRELKLKIVGRERAAALIRRLQGVEPI